MCRRGKSRWHVTQDCKCLVTRAEVNLESQSGRLNVSRTLPGHREEVVWASVDWGASDRRCIKAATISLDQDVLLWEVPWSSLQATESLRSKKGGRAANADAGNSGWKARQLGTKHAYRTRVVAHDAASQSDGVSALTGSSCGNIYAWKVTADPVGVVAGQLTAHTDQISTLSVDWKQGMAVSGSCDATMRIWNVRLQTCEGILPHPGSVRTAIVDWANQRAVSTSTDDAARVWDLEVIESEMRPHAILRTQDGVIREAIASFSTGCAAFVARCGNAEFWDLESQVCTARLQSHPGTLYSFHLGAPDVQQATAEEPGDRRPSQHRRDDTCGELQADWPTITPAQAISCGKGWCRSVL